jgi:hypothetical protein
MGLFLRAGASLPSTVPQDIPFIEEFGSNNDVLLAHVISTKSTNKPVRDEDMDYPPNWKSDPQGDYDVGHKKNGRTIALHALAVSPDYQRSGLGKAIMRAYIERMKQINAGDRISILTYDRLVPYYQKLGFEHYGKSESEYAGVAWHDLVSEFVVASNCSSNLFVVLHPLGLFIDIRETLWLRRGCISFQLANTL